MRVSLQRVVVPLVALTVFSSACGDNDQAERSATTTVEIDSPDASGTASAPTPPTSASGVLPAGPGVLGVTDEVIRLGVMTVAAEATAEANRQAGGAAAEEVPVANHDDANAAALDAINAAGGIAGRRVEFVVYDYDMTNIAQRLGREEQIEKACAFWTQDNDVFAMTMERGYGESAADCAANTGVPWVRTTSTGGYLMSAARYESMSDYYYAPNGIIADRRERALPIFLADHGFFEAGLDGKEPRVALLTEEAHAEGVESGMKPALAELGIEPVLEIVYPDVFESDWNNYILQLQQKDVTHVLFSNNIAGTPQLYLMTAAEEQEYRPLWGTASDFNAFSYETLLPPAQAENTWVMGWSPVTDIADHAPQSETARLCDDAMAARGVVEAPGQSAARDKCEFVFFLKAALEMAPELSVDGLAQGVAALGNAYESALLFDGSSQFGNGRHDGVEQVRLLRFDPEKMHFTYAAPAVPIP